MRSARGQTCGDGVEIGFGVMSRNVLRGASFRTGVELWKAIQISISAYNPKPKPF